MNLKIELTLEEKVIKTLVIDTDDFELPKKEDDRIFKIAELINELKVDPVSFFDEDLSSVDVSRERLSVKVFKV